MRHCGQRFIIQIQRFGLGCIFSPSPAWHTKLRGRKWWRRKLPGTRRSRRGIFNTNDPASLLYSALWHQEGNQVNAAIRDLKQSGELNDHRSAFRSQLLPDQDAAVRGANLADIYHDAGMDDVSVREATRAVNFGYADYSAHLFLADSYNPLHNPNLIDPREATAWSGEFLVANLLAPVGAGTLCAVRSEAGICQAVSTRRFRHRVQHQLFQPWRLDAGRLRAIRNRGQFRLRGG